MICRKGSEDGCLNLVSESEKMSRSGRKDEGGGQIERLCSRRYGYYLIRSEQDRALFARQ